MYIQPLHPVCYRLILYFKYQFVSTSINISDSKIFNYMYRYLYEFKMWPTLFQDNNLFKVRLRMLKEGCKNASSFCETKITICGRDNLIFDCLLSISARSGYFLFGKPNERVLQLCIYIYMP